MSELTVSTHANNLFRSAIRFGTFKTPQASSSFFFFRIKKKFLNVFLVMECLLLLLMLVSILAREPPLWERGQGWRPFS